MMPKSAILVPADRPLAEALLPCCMAERRAILALLDTWARRAVRWTRDHETLAMSAPAPMRCGPVVAIRLDDGGSYLATQDTDADGCWLEVVVSPCGMVGPVAAVRPRRP